MNRPDDITEQAVAGDRQATRDLFRAVYDDLRRVAAARLAGEAPGQTLTATALVHEAFLKLGPESLWNDSAHLYRTAAKVMRQILIDAARRKQSLKRGGILDRQDLNSDQVAASRNPIDPVEFDEAIGKLEAANPLASTVFEMRYYAGLTWENIAQELGISVEKTESLWSYARAKLAQSLSAPP
jgi:RNA polymerase sigma factor (TIGR02999 family)